MFSPRCLRGAWLSRRKHAVVSFSFHATLLFGAGFHEFGCRTAHAHVDLNGNGYGDLWERRFHAASLTASADLDGDGASNAQEAVAGTDPNSAHSRLAITQIAANGTTLTFSCQSVPGKIYRLLSAASLSATVWTPEGGWKAATGNTVQFDLPGGVSGAPRFFKVEVADVDTDSDGVSDWEELQVAGFNAYNPQGASPGTGDLASMTSLLSVTASAIVPVAYEKSGAPAEFLLARTGTMPLTVPIAFGGNASAAKGSAQPSDYTLVDGNGAALAGAVTFPAGATSVRLVVRPVADAVNEVPETLGVRVAGSAVNDAEVRVCDAAPIAANRRLFVAYLLPPSGVASSASGIATVRLEGDNDLSLVNKTFSGLTSPESSAGIHVANPETGPDIRSLPAGQLDAQPWQVRAAQFLGTDQAVLDRLFSGGLYVSVNSGNYPAGEILGDLVLTQGSTELQVPPDPPPVPALTGSDLDRDVARFLTQATFGPTPALMAEVKQLVADHGGDRLAGYGAWIDRQLDPAQVPSPSLLQYMLAADAQEIALYRDPSAPYYNATYAPGTSNRRRGWWLFATRAPDQLRQRMAFALSEILVVSDKESVVGVRGYGHCSYYQMLLDGAFGSYRTLLQNVSLHPIMGQYLSHLRNQKQVVDGSGNVIVSPDENYAREVMQLFSIGLVKLLADGSVKLDAASQPIPTYDQTDITEMSRIFTGWSFSVRNSPSNSTTVINNTNFNHGNGSQYYESQWMNPMKMFPAYHDTGQKVILDGLVISAGQTGEQDLAAAMDALANHENTAPFIARRLIQRLVTSNPGAGYVYRVAQRWQQTSGNLGAVIKAILLDYEARDLSRTMHDGAGKKREPLLRYVALMRAFDGKSQLPLSALQAYGYPQAELDKFPAGTTRYRMGTTETSLAQTPMSAPTVFNWFLPDFSMPGPLAAGGLVAPEFQLSTETTVITQINFHYSLIFGSTGQGGTALPNQTSANDENMVINLAPLQQLYDTAVAGGASATQASTTLVDYIDLLLCAGKLKADYPSATGANPRAFIINAVAATSAGSRIRNAVYLVATSPQFIIAE